MIGSLNFASPSKEVTIVGGGVAGLMFGVILDQCGYEVTLYEKQSETGGMLSTEETQWGIAEKAAHSFLITPRFQSFCDELKVQLLPLKPDSRARYILRDGQLKRFSTQFKRDLVYALAPHVYLRSGR